MVRESLVLFLVGMIGASDLRAAVVLRASANPTLTDVGRKIVYEVIATTPPGATIEWPATGQGLEEFQIQDFEWIEEKKVSGGQMQSGVRYVLNTFTSGDYVIPAMTLRFKDPEGQAGEAKAPSLFITVRSTEVGVQDDLKDIRGPLAMPGRWPKLAWGALAGGFALIVAWGIWRRRKRSGQGAPEAPPWEAALKQLEGLNPQEAAQTGQWKDLYVAISWILREYLEGRFAASALEETTSEIEPSLREAGLSEDLTLALLDCLRSCDQVKYAKSCPGPEEIVSLHRNAVAFVKDTTPRPEVEEAA